MPKSSFKPSKVVKKNLPSMGAWLTNAGKSVGVAAMDVITDTLPATAEMATSAAEFVQNFKSNITDLSSQKESIASAMDLAYWKDLANTAKNNTIEDLKSGKLYHSMNDIYDENFGDDFDLDFGDDFDMGDDDDYDVNFNSEDGTTSVKTRHTKDGDTDVNQVNVKVDVGNDSKVAKMVESQTMAAVDYHREDIMATKESTTAIVTSISQSMGGLSGLMSSIDSNVASMTTMVTTISQGTSVQMKYYEDSMAIFNTISSLLTEIKQATSSNLMGAGQEQKEYTDVLDLFSGNGVLDVSGYMDLVKKQFGSAVDRNFFLMSVKNMLSDKDQIKAFVAHPISNMINSFVKQVIPATLRETATAFDNTLRETLVSGLFQVRGLAESDNPILQFLGETFGITNKLKQNIDRANYKRGKVDWDGQSHKTLNEVIPYYLRKIASALTGEREVGFDYNAGVFKNVKTMRDEYQEDDNRRLTSGFSSVKGDFKDFLNKGGFVFSNTKGEKDVTDTMDKFLRTLVTSGRSIRRRKNENTGEYSFIDDVADIVSSGDKDNDYVKLISAFLDTRERSSVMETLGRQILESRAAFSKFKQREESGEILTNSMYAKETGTTVDQGFDKDTGKALYNSKSPLIDKDKYGNTATYYLRNMLELLAKGITTFPVFSGHTGLNIFGNNPNPPSSTTTRPNNGSDILKNLAEAESKYKKEEETDRARIKGREKDKEQIDKEIQNGKVLISNIGGDGSYADFVTRAQQFEAARIEGERDKSGDDSWFKKITGIDSDKPISKIVNKFTEYLTKPTTVITDMFKKADDFLFKLVFGGDLGVKNSVFKKSLDFVKNQFTRFSTWLNDSILEPLHEKFFGDNGLFNQLKQTSFGQAVSDFFGNARTTIFGEKNEDGEYVGGFFSDYANDLGNNLTSIKNEIVGDAKAVGVAVVNSAANALLGEDADGKSLKEKGKTLWDKLANTIDDWMATITGGGGEKGESEFVATMKQVGSEVKGSKLAADATISAGIATLLFGNPWAGVAVGSMVSTVKQSDTVQELFKSAGIDIDKFSVDGAKDLLFGEKDADGNRVGGVLTPLADKIKEGASNAVIQVSRYVEKNVISTLAIAFDPIVEEGKRVATHVKAVITDTVTGVAKTVYDHVISPAANEVKAVFKPVTDAAKKVTKATLHVVGSTAALPFKILEATAYGLDKKHYRQDKREFADETIGNAFTFNKEKRKKMGLSETATTGERIAALAKFLSGEGRPTNKTFEFNGKTLTRRQYKKEIDREIEAYADYLKKTPKKDRLSRAEFDEKFGYVNWKKEGARRFKTKAKDATDSVNNMNVESTNMSVDAKVVELKGDLSKIFKDFNKKSDNDSRISEQKFIDKINTVKERYAKNGINIGNTEAAIQAEMFQLNKGKIAHASLINKFGDANKTKQQNDLIKRAYERDKAIAETKGEELDFRSWYRKHKNDFSNNIEDEDRSGRTTAKFYDDKKRDDFLGITKREEQRKKELAEYKKKRRKELFESQKDKINARVESERVEAEKQGIKFDATKSRKRAVKELVTDVITKEDIEGKRSKGGLIKKLGAYILSKGERVIPSGNKGDAEKEDNFFNKLKSRFSRDDATAKRKETADEELKATQAKGSFETKEKLRKEQAEKEEQRTWREKISETLTNFKDSAVEHYNNWSGVFGKKGKIALALLALSPVIARIAGLIVDLMNGQGLLSTIADHIQSAIDSIGGIKNVVERIKKLGNDFKELLFGEDSLLTRIGNFLFPKDENGENQYTGRSEVAMKIAGKKLPKGINKITDGIIDHNEKVRQRALDYAEGKDVRKTWINRYDDTINATKKIPEKVTKAKEKVFGKVDSNVFTKAEIAELGSDGYASLVDDLAKEGYNVKKDLKGNLRYKKRGAGLISNAKDFVSDKVTNSGIYKYTHRTKIKTKVISVDDFDSVGDYVKKVQQLAKTDGVKILEDADGTLTYSINKDTLLKRAKTNKIERMASKESKALEKLKRTDTVKDKIAQKYEKISEKYGEKRAKRQENVAFKKRQKQFRTDWKAAEKDAKRAEKLRIREENATEFQKYLDSIKEKRSTKKTAKLDAKKTKWQKQLDKLNGKADDITQTKLGKKIFKPKDAKGVLKSSNFGANGTDDFLKTLDTLTGTKGVNIISDTVDDAGRVVKFTSKKTGKVTEAVKAISGKSRQMAKTKLTNKIAGKSNVKAVTGKVMTKLSSVTEGKGAASGAMKMLNGAFDAITKAVQKLVKKFTGGKGAKGFLGKLSGFFKTIVKKLTSGQELSKFMSKVSAKIGAAASGIGILMGLAGGTKANTANLFFVDEEDVDLKMRAISLLWSELQNLPTWIPGAGQIGTAALIIDVVNELVAEIMGIDFIREASTLIYGILSDDEGTKKLTDAQSKFEQQYNSDMDALYQEYAQKQAASGQEVLSMDDWKAQGLGKSLNEYNDEKHKTIGHKIFDKLKGTGKGIKDSAIVKDIRSTHMGDIFKKNYWAVSDTKEDGTLKTSQEIFKEKAGKVLMAPVTFIKGMINNQIEAFTGFIDIIKTTVKTFGTNTKDAFKSITGGTTVFKPEYWNPPTTDDKSDAGNLSQIAFYLNRIVMFLPGLIFGVGKSIGKGIGTIVDKVKKGATLIKDTTDFSKITSLADVFKGEYWKAPEDPQNPMNAMQRAVFYGGRLITLLPSAVIGLGKDIGKMFAPIIDPIKKAAGPLIDKIKGSFNKDDDQEPEPDKLGGINRVLYYTAKLLGFVPKVVMKIGSVVGGIVTPIFKGIKTVVGSVFTGVEDIMTDPTRVFTKEFWSYNAADVGNAPKEIGTMGMILHIAGKLLSFPAAGILASFKTAGKLIGPVISGVVKVVPGVISNSVNRFKNLWSKGIVSIGSGGKLQSGLSGFFDIPNKEDGPLGVVQTVLSGITGVMTYVPLMVVGMIGTAKNAIKTVIDAFKKVGEGVKDMSMTDEQIKNTSLKEFFSDAMDKNSNDDTTGLTGFLNKTGRIMYSVVFIWKKYISPITDTVGQMFAGIGSSIANAWEGFQEKWESFKTKFGTVIDIVKDFFGFGGNGEAALDQANKEPVVTTIPYGHGSGEKKLLKRKLKDKLLGGNGPAPDTENGFPYYSQNDPRIKDKPYRMSNGQPTDVIETMGNRGCGPTAMAMVASKLKGGNGNPYSPENMARIAENGNYSTQNGTMPNYFTNVGTQLGMNVTPALATAGNIDAMLGNGQPVIIQGASDRNDSPFTSGGHYVVAVGKDDSGNVLVNDPRGKSYSGKYTMNQLTDGSARAWGFSNPGGFGGTIVNTVKGGFGKVKKLLKSVMGGNGASWIDVVKAVKKAIASKKPGYSQTRSIKITVGGRTISVRTDCSGMVSACVTIYGGKNYLTNSTGFTNKSNSTLLALGFKPLSWSGWDNLQEGDIISKVGHVEIFCRNSGGKHYVYNAGGTDSINNPNATKTGHSSGYTTVWRAPGKSVDVNVSTSGKVSTSGTETSTATGGLTKYSAAISQLASEMLKPFQPEQTGDTTTSTSKDYSGADISGSDTAQKVWNFFTSIGYSKAATAGILGNLYQESGVNPKSNADKPNSPAAGIAQWENFKKKNGRWKKLSDYAASKGKKWTDLKSQLEFIDKELHGLDHYFKTDVKYSSRPGSTLSVAGATPTTFKKWKKSNDVDMATRQFEGAFERAGKPMMERRLGAAKKYYKLYSGGDGEGLIGGNGDMNIPYVNNSSRDIRNKPYTNSSDDVRYIAGNGNSAINQSLSRTEKLSKENSTYDDANVVAALGTVVNTLEDLLVEMRGTNEGVNKFNDKELVVKNTPVVYQQTNNNNIQAGNGSGETQKPPKTVNNSTFIDDNKYRLARSIASGGYSFA